MLKRHARHHLHRRADPRRADRQAARGAPLQPGLRDRALHRVGAGRHGGARAHASRRPTTSSPSSAPSSSASACRPGVGLNHRLTHFQHLFSGSGYAAGLLRLPVGRGARRRRLRGLRRGRQSVRPGGRAAAASASSTRRATRSSRAPPTAPSAAARRRREPMLQASAAWSRRYRGLALGLGARRRPAEPGKRFFSAARKTREVDRLGPVVGEAGGEAALDVLGHGVGRQRDAGDRRGARARRAAGAAPRSRRSRAAAGRPARGRAAGPRPRDAGPRRWAPTTIARPRHALHQLLDEQHVDRLSSM